MRRTMKLAMGLLLGLLMAWWLSSCHPQNLLPGQPLAAVDPLPLPQLPAWIEQISPTGEAKPLSQIRIRFKDPLIPVESLDGEGQQKLDLFEITPALPGRFRFLTPRMVGFQMDEAIPMATRVRVTLKAGLEDLNNHRLDQDLAWTFNTEPVKLVNLPGLSLESTDEVEPIDLQPALEVTSNVELDLATLQEKAALIPEGSDGRVGVRVALKDDTQASESTRENSPQQQFDPSQKPWIYTLTPERSLAQATTYRVEIAPGLRPAKGNLPSETPFVSKVKTYAPLAFQGIELTGQPDAGGAFGRFVAGVATLKFNNGLSAEEAIAQVQISPPPKPSPQPVRVYEGDRAIALNPWSLEPATTYTITLGANLKDKFGQTLGKPVTVEYSTGDVAPEFWAPTDLNIFPASKNLQLNLSAINLPEASYRAAFRVIQPTDLVYVDSAYPYGEGKDLLPKPATWQSFPLPAQTKNQSTEVAIPLKEQLGGETGMLAYGVQAKTYQYLEDGRQTWREPSYYGLVQLTNLGVFAQWFPESGLVRVHQLSDGKGVGNAQIEVYESQLEAKSIGSPAPCATGTTDETGTLVFNAATLRGCFKGKASFQNPPQLLTIARLGQDWSFVRTLDWSGDYDYGMSLGWNADKPESRGTIFSDRQLYQPGETGWFTGIATYLKNGELRQDKNVRYTITMEDPNGKITNLGTQTTNEFGTFSLEVPLERTQPLGFYTMRAKSDAGVEILGEFRVAEFKPPNFRVDLTLDKEIAQMGETVTAKTQSNYLFGPPVQGGKVKYYVTRQRAYFVPPGWEQFSFGRQWFWPEEEPTISPDVLQTSGALDSAGSSSQAVSVEPGLPYPMTYRVDAQVSDVSNLSVSSSKEFTVLVSDRLIGLNSDFVATANQPFKVQVIVTDPQGRAIANQPVRVELQKMNYSSVTQVIEGSRTAKDQVEYQTVAQQEVRSGQAPVTVELTPNAAGSYRIRANFTNRREEVTATDLQIWTTGEGTAVWGDRYTNERLELELDKETYKPGETATVLIQSPYPAGELYFSVVRHGTLLKRVTKVTGSAPKVQFQVTPEMLPNAAVEAVLVRQGTPLEQISTTELDTLKDLVRIGLTPFKVNVEDRYLKAQVTPAQQTLQPGQSQTLQLQLQDAQGRPTAGQFTVMVVNEAVRQLTDYRPPNLVETVYAEQPVSTRFGDNRADVVLQQPSSPIDKGWGYGGGFAAGAGSTRIRTDFKALAYYNGALQTDDQGRASVTFTLPDDLTTWRVMVVATDGKLHYGNGEATFVTTKPLVTNPVLPQFARPGDRLQIGLAVTNNTGNVGTLSISGSVHGGLSLETSQTNTIQTQSNAPANGATAAYRFPVVVQNENPSKIQLRSQLNGNEDGFEVPLEIRSQHMTEQVVDTGATQSRVQIPLNINPPQDHPIGGLDLTLASTLIPEITQPAKQVLQEEQLPFLETAASQLAIAASLHYLSQTFGQTFGEYRPPQQAANALERLQRLQRPDGGFASFPRQEQSDPFVSPYAAESIALATEVGFEVNAGLRDRLKTYLQKILANPAQYDYCKQQACQDRVRLGALLGLEALGDRRSDFLADLYERRAQFDPMAQIQLARLLSGFSEWQTEANAWTAQLQETIYQTGRTATVNAPQGWAWLGSATATQSEALRLFTARNAPMEQLDRLAQGLLDQRRQGTWGSTYDNAQALTALTAYSRLLPEPPNFTATATLANKSLLSAQFQGYNQTTASTSVPMADLPRGNQTLTLQKSGQGTLRYLATYRYPLPKDAPGRFNGLRVTRQIHPANQTTVLKRMGLVSTREPFTVQAGQVFDIELEIVTDHPVNHVLITDPLPAGLEAVDASFQTSTRALQARSDSWQIGYQTIYRDRIVAYGDRLDAGVYTLHYLARSVTPGTFLYPGTEAHLQYAPEEFGRAATTVLTVSESSS